MTPKKIALTSLVLLGVAFLAVVAANALDYYRIHRAIARLDNLSEAQLRAMGDAAAKITNHTHGSNPAGFEALGPVKFASLGPEISDFLLYELDPPESEYRDGQTYLNFRISTSPSNQEISYFTNSEGRQRTKVLWNRNPDYVRKLSPENRLLTINQWAMSDSLAWIVMRDRILLVHENGRGVTEPAIIGEAPLDQAALNRIQTALTRLPDSARGKVYLADGVFDGVALRISFAPDGKERADDVRISNTWVEEFRPLLTAVSELGPKDHPIPFIKEMATDERLREYPTTVRTKAEQDRREWGELKTPWWCVWRKWLK